MNAAFHFTVTFGAEDVALAPGGELREPVDAPAVPVAWPVKYAQAAPALPAIPSPSTTTVRTLTKRRLSLPPSVERKIR